MEFERLAKNEEKAFCCAENGRSGVQWKAVTIALQLGVLNSFDRVFNKNPFFYTVEMWKTMLKVLKTRLNPVEIRFFCCYSDSFFSWKTLQNWRGKPENAGEKSIPLVENLVVILTGKRCNTVCLTIHRAIRVFNTVGENCVEKCRKGWGKGASNQQMGGGKAKSAAGKPQRRRFRSKYRCKNSVYQFICVCLTQRPSRQKMPGTTNML